MQRLRSIWVLRLIVALLAVSLGPTVAGAAAHAAPDSAGAYADWLQNYLQDPTDPAVEQALEAARTSHTTTFDRFLRIFVDTYQAQHSGVPLAQVFSVRAQSTDALVQLLYGQFQQKLDGSTTPQATISAAPSLLVGVTDRALFVVPSSVNVGRVGTSSNTFLPHEGDELHVFAVRASWAAFPQGP